MLKFLKFGKSYTVTCPDGSIKTVYKDVNDAFPLYIEGGTKNIAAKSRAESMVDVEITSEHASKIDGLLYSLDELNQGLMMTFRAVYVTYSADPCGTADFFQREISKLLDEQRKLRALKIQIDSLITMVKASPDNSEQLTQVFSEIVQRIGHYPSQEIAIDEMKKAERDVKILSGGSK